MTAVRFTQDWLQRSPDRVIAARSTVSRGIKAFGATQGQDPDGQFWSWLGQFQWAMRFEYPHWAQRFEYPPGIQVIFRTDLQLTNNSLLPTEQCAVGGIDTVRGYRQNQLVRDQCLITSLEFRIPLFQVPLPGIDQATDQGILQLAPFFDYGRATNKDLPTPEQKSIYSAGVGLRWEVTPSIQAVVYWGHGFRHIDQTGHDLQDNGIFFNIQVAYPW